METRAEEGVKERVNECIALLEEAYGEPRRGRPDPVDLLVSTILSQNTTDVNCLRAFSRLKRAYPDYHDLLEADDGEVAALISVGGLAGIKAPRIKDALARIEGDAGSIDLGFLENMGLEEAREYLTSISGVGPKTAAVVLLFGFGKGTMPVDTHVYRVSRRIGLVPEKASIAAAQRTLEDITPLEKYVSLHINLIRHGRKVCKARAPLCSGCPLLGVCDYGFQAKGLNDKTSTPTSRSGSVARPIMKDSHSFD